jgi:hypothetical protein
MVTRLNLGALLVMVVACGGSTTASPVGASTSTPAPSSTQPPTQFPPGGTSYDGHGFVVHEWGTNTIVVGSDGSLQRGLHHEEEDLPAFVMDRMKATKLGAPVEVKMETPVTYFYAPAPMTAQVSVQFPLGVLTQWYPQVQSFYPLLAHDTNGVIDDPVLDAHFKFGSSTCQQHYSPATNGLLDWGTVQIGPRGGGKMLFEDAPLDKYTWSFARQVDSNPVTVNGQNEHFLFYRGLGNNPLPVKIAASNDAAGYDGGITLSYDGDAKGPPLGSVYVLRVGPNGGAFKLHTQGLYGQTSLTDVAPSLDGAMPLDAFAAELGKSMVSELDKTGLFHDESVAMVHTWERQWFRTPGVRVLYLLPQSYTDAQIPLTITPQPDAIKRVMMIRVEVITHALEDEDAKAESCLDAQGPSGTCAQHFLSLGRFAEPRLRRAIATTGGSKVAFTLLDQIQGANVSVASGE